MPWKQRDLINLDKIKAVGEILREFSEIQRISKKLVFNPQPRIRTYILTAEVWDEHDFIKMAQLKEEFHLFLENNPHRGNFFIRIFFEFSL